MFFSHPSAQFAAALMIFKVVEFSVSYVYYSTVDLHSVYYFSFNFSMKKGKSVLKALNAVGWCQLPRLMLCFLV
jgi:hypothetical protein